MTLVRYLKWKRNQVNKNRLRKSVAKRLPVGQIGVELGVWRGDHSQLLLNVARPLHLFLVDKWQVGKSPDQEGSFIDPGRFRQEELDRIKESVKKRFDTNPRVNVLEMDTVEAVSRFKTHEGWGQVDWVYVDADHRYSGCLADMIAWWPLLRSGGVMFGDDYTLGKWWGDGVVKAVNTFAGMKGVPLQIKKDQWWIRKP